jgi:hypothetical protein
MDKKVFYRGHGGYPIGVYLRGGISERYFKNPF